MAITLPPLRKTIARWKAIAMLEQLLFHNFPPQLRGLNHYMQREQCAVGSLDDHAGSGLNLRVIGERGFCYGFAGNAPNADDCKDIELRARKWLAGKHADLAAMLPKESPKAYGWTFVAWTDGMDTAWKPVPRLAEAFKGRGVPPQVKLLRATETKFLKWVHEDLEQPDIDATVKKLLNAEPITIDEATEVMERRRPSFVREMAGIIGYPLAKGR